MSYTKRAVKGSAVIFTISLVSIALGFFLRTFLARNLSVAEFGLIYSVLAFMGIFSLFRDMGLNQALIKYIPEFVVKNDMQSIKSSVVFVFLVQFCAAVLAMVPVFVFSEFLAQNFFKTQLSIPVLQFLALTFIASVLFHLMQAFFQGSQNMKFYAVLEPARMAFVLATSVIFISLGMGVYGASIGYFIGIVLASFIGGFLALRTFPFFSTKTRIDTKIAKHLFGFAFPVILAGVVSISTGYADTLLLTLFRTLEEVGYYQVAAPIADAAGLFVGAMSIVAFPMVSELWARKEKDAISGGVHIMMKAAILILAPVAAIIISSPDLIISILFTDKYLAGAAALQVLTLGVVFQSLTIILFSLLKGIGMPMLATKSVAVLAVTDFVANLILIPPFGIMGAAFATAAAFTITFFVTLVMARRHIRITFPYIPAAKAIFSGFLIALFITGIRPFAPDDNLLKLIITSSMGLVLYTFLISVLGAVKRNDIRVLSKIIYMPKWVYKFFRD